MSEECLKVSVFRTASSKQLITPSPRAIIKRRSEVLILSADSYFSTHESSRNFFRLDAKRFHWSGDIQAGFADQNDLFILRFAEIVGHQVEHLY